MNAHETPLSTVDFICGTLLQFRVASTTLCAAEEEPGIENGAQGANAYIRRVQRSTVHRRSGDSRVTSATCLRGEIQPEEQYGMDLRGLGLAQDCKL